MAFGERIGLSEEEQKALRLGGFLHDLGKIAVPDGVLLKAGPLSADERQLMEEHPAAGDRLVVPMRTLGLVRPIIRHHHERWDGRGYPDRLGGEEVPPRAPDGDRRRLRCALHPSPVQVSVRRGGSAQEPPRGSPDRAVRSGSGPRVPGAPANLDGRPSLSLRPHR